MQKSLLSLLQGAKDIEVVKGPVDECLVTKVVADSRQVGSSSMFFALPGSSAHGISYVKEAVDRGASVVVVPADSVDVVARDIPQGVVLLSSTNPRVSLGYMASAFYDHPSDRIDVIGITGTNGKTTCSFLLERILSCSGAKCGLSGTIVQKIGAKASTSLLTTPDAVSFHGFLSVLVKEGAKYAVTEVSSHGLDQDRVAGCRFRAAIFTNLSHDHLDYHGDMESYFKAKRLLFQKYCPRDAIINLDDSWGKRLWAEYDGRKLSYGLSEEAMVRAEDYQIDASGIRAFINLKGQTIAVRSPFIGLHNLYNILAAAAAALCLGIQPEKIKEGIESLKAVAGRLERVAAPDGVTALVDYAHTPDALKNVLECLKGLATNRLLTVVGCGGDRDKTKRPEMAKIASEVSDLCIFTSDNPRTESAEAIIQDMLKGLSSASRKMVKVITDRKEAIFWAASQAKAGDILLVAGKGHEDYQIIGQKKLPFDDKRILEQAFKSVKSPIMEKRDSKNLLCLDDVRQAVSGRFLKKGGETYFSSINTDSRRIRPGELFWALRGENFDGHQFVVDAADKGAAGAVVEYVPQGLPHDFPLIIVEDSLKALGDFASWYKEYIGYKVFAITGSCGKTTTKELILSVLKTRYKSSGTSGNFNNLIGLPLTMLSVAPGTEWAVLEMGTNLPGEIERLCQIARPEAGLVTCIRPVHLEGLGSLENIATEKTALFRNIPVYGTAVINLDEPLIRQHLAEISCSNLVGYTFRKEGPEVGVSQVVRLVELCQDSQGLKLKVSLPSGDISIKSRLFGKVNGSNILAAIAAGVALGVDAALIKQGIERVEAQGGRLKMERLSGGWILLDDSYNANPSSVKAAIETLGDASTNEKMTLMLGDMLELGSGSEGFHRDVGTFAAGFNPDLIITVGPLARHIAKGALLAGFSKERLFSFDSTDTLLSWLSQEPNFLFNGSRRSVLVKGSRGVRLERAALYIRERFERED